MDNASFVVNAGTAIGNSVLNGSNLTVNAGTFNANVVDTDANVSTS